MFNSILFANYLVLDLVPYSQKCTRSYGQIFKMKTSWSRKCLNSYGLNIINSFANRGISLQCRSTLSRPILLQKSLLSGVKWQQLAPRTASHVPSSCNNGVLLLIRQLHLSSTSKREAKKPETLQELVTATEKQETAVTVGQKVVQAGKDVSYFGIILAGFAVTGALLWYVLSELFLSSSPNKVYADALKKVKRNEEVMDELGQPIKAYGEETSRGRRRHVSFQEYVVAGENYMRVKFYVAGQRRKGTVHVDIKQIASRKFEYRFIFVELEGFPPRTIIIEDNR